MDDQFITVAIRLTLALLAGGIIGLERTYHGRPAGFRTHTLVCTSSTLLILVSVYQWDLLPNAPLDTIRADPTRMAQGIMTGFGFLGAGVIYKEYFTVRGLTTAASIWITAAIGIMIGVGFYFPAILSTLLAIGILSVFRRIEAIMPTQSYSHYAGCFDRNNTMPEEQLRTLLQQHGFDVTHMSFRITNNGQVFEYQTVIRPVDNENTARLANALRQLEQVREYRNSPTRGR